MKIKSYLSFNGNAEEALNFYAGVFNGTINEVSRYADYPGMEFPADYQSKLMHSELKLDGASFYLADAMPGVKTDFGSAGHTIMVECDTEQQLVAIYEKLAVGGQIKCELCQPFYAKQYAEIMDKFGVLWSLIVMGECNIE